MPHTSKKAMDLFLRDLAVAMETGLRDYQNRNHRPDAKDSVSSYLSGLKCAQSLAHDAMARMRNDSGIPDDFHEFLGLVEREVKARILQSEPKEPEELKQLKSPGDQAIFEEAMMMFHECALRGGEMPEPRMGNGKT